VDWRPRAARLLTGEHDALPQHDILPASLCGSGRDVVLHYNTLTAPELFDAVLVGAIGERGEQAHDLERAVAGLEPDTLTDLEPVRHCSLRRPSL
jgi:hypothetical protein